MTVVKNTHALSVITDIESRLRLLILKGRRFGEKTKSLTIGYLSAFGWRELRNQNSPSILDTWSASALGRRLARVLGPFVIGEG